MICPVCQSTAARSTVRILGTKQTDMPKDIYFDEDGAEHSHNPNVVTTRFRCSNGHVFQERSSWECHCGYRACEAVVEVVGEQAT